MAQSVSAPPVATTDVHVTGRRILATIADGLVIGLVFGGMPALFGSGSAEGGQVSASLSGPAFLA